tara:strand:+ start:1925 stop:2434 length:510 start_codon:yes stop_codon:yes gene_type:complete
VTEKLIGFPPRFTDQATILVLGSMPGRASLDASEYYAHPRNAFWPIMAQVFGFDANQPYEQRVDSLLQHKVALWDVVHRCVRTTSLDSDIVSDTVEVNDFGSLFVSCPQIHRVCLNGQAAARLYRRHVLQELPQAREIEWQVLPSTSPAHAAMRFEEKCQQWQQALLKQ